MSNVRLGCRKLQIIDFCDHNGLCVSQYIEQHKKYQRNQKNVDDTQPVEPLKKENEIAK